MSSPALPSAAGRCGPIPTQERIADLDVVRGFALLGILIMNMPGFSTSFFAGADGSLVWTGTVDRIAEGARDMLFSGKFNSMFSLLFGLGFTIQLGRMMARDPARAPWLYVRRLLVLGAFGLIHSMVFWNGDVLHIYAVLGFALLFLRNVSNRTVYVLLGICLIYPLISGLLRLAVITPEMVKNLVAEEKAWEASNNLAFGHGTFFQAAREHTREFFYDYGTLLNVWGFLGFYVQMATTMLIGFLIGRNGWVQRIPEFLPLIRKLQWRGLALGLVLAATFGIIFELNRAPGPSLIKIVGSNAYVLCRLALMGFYVLTIVRLMQSPEWQSRFAPIAATGRMPLTNYLSQTLMATTLFYGWGFGLFGKVGPALGLVISFAIYFLIQVPLSVWWLRRHEYGPMEYLWRRLTYAQPSASQPAAASVA
jgi:uncharacterized protein